MVVGDASINNIMSGIENAGGVKQHNHKKKLKQRFDIIKKLGQGTFGKVQLGINKETGQEVAIKTIKKSKIESEADLIRIRREIQIMSSVQHPNIIHIYEVFENREKMVLVMEYAAGGELYDYLSERKVLEEDEARRIFRQIATACYYCHKHKICHRDLKLENILLDENNNAKIADFGLSNVFDDQRLLSTFCGSPLYASPEIVKGTPYQGPEVDCWSLGVLLYTLVYGAMPFDGSNFKRLVKQISQGDYYEPAKPSPASPLIRDMLTVNPKHRADVEKICTHWWVNENYDVSCLDISEELANQTPVRLDLLLSLAPPPPQLESDKLVVTGEDAEEIKTEAVPPTRSQSAGSLMELAHPAERRIKDMLNDDKSPKRKLQSTVSTDRIRDTLKRKDKIIKENTVADITLHGAIQEDASLEDASMASEANNNNNLPLDRSLTQTLSADNEDNNLQGAACTEILEEEAKKTDVKKPVINKIKKTPSTSVTNKVLEGINEIPSQENIVVDKENVEDIAQEVKPSTKKVTNKPALKKKVLSDKNEADTPTNNKKSKTPDKEDVPDEQTSVGNDETSSKPIERRRSRIFEAAEKFRNMITPTDTVTKPAPVEKPKKIVIPGVNVDGFKKEYERKASLTSTSPPQIKTAEKTKKILIDQQQKSEDVEDDQKERVRNAVNIISSALDKEGTRKSKSRPCCVRKPPVPFGASGRSASGNIGLLTSPPVGAKPFVRPCQEVKKVEEKPEPVEESKTSSAEITLKSATLPRRKTTKAEIQLNYPVPKPATMEFKTEMAHNVTAPPKVATQRSEVVVPVAGHPSIQFRAASAESDQSARASKERIIPISFEQETQQEIVQSPPAKPPMPRLFQTQKSNNSQRSNSLSRQSTQDSDTETTSLSGEPIKKSPREYIIPIAVEGGGYVTPRAGSVEPSDTASTTSTMTNKSRSKFGSRPRRLNERDSEDDSTPYSTLYRHSSFGKDSDNEDSRKDAFHLHRLRSTRPKKSLLEHNDSLSSGEEDDDDGFEILTAEHLFSNLLARVRDLTQKLNVEDGGRPGFPSSRLLSHFDQGSFFNSFHNRLSPLSRHSSLGRSVSRDRGTTENSSSATPWRRSVSRDLASDIESVFKDPTTTARPRGDIKPKQENLNLANLDLSKLKLSEEDALALSYLTPGLSRRIQKQLLSQLSPSEARKLHRTLSSGANNPYKDNSTLPRQYSVEKESKSSLPVKTDPDYSSYQRPKTLRTMSLREPKIYSSTRSPDSSLSEAVSTDSYSSLSRPALNKYLTPTPSNNNKTDISITKPSASSPRPRRISRFLRPDFFDAPKEENILVKEKKEREMETQKVLKEIRDKRKFRLNSARRERSLSKETQNKFLDSGVVKEADLLLNDVSNNIKNLESNVNKIHDYVNMPGEDNKLHDYVNVKGTPSVANKPEQVVKKSRISRLVRPKSYPTEDESPKISPDKESKISRLRKGFTRQDKTTKEDKNESNEEEKGHKNKLLQSIERKLEKFRASTHSNKDGEEVKASREKKSGVENAIKRLREQSLPRNLEPCTESGLIKRAVSVEDLSNLNTNKPLQASRKSVTKILGLFKKYEEQDKQGKVVKKKKLKSPEACKTNKNLESSAVMLDKNNDTCQAKKLERPRSLLLEKMRNFQNSTESSKAKASKLPVNSNFRRSLNLETLDNTNKNNTPDRRSLKLDLVNKSSVNINNNNNNNSTEASTSFNNGEISNKDENRNSVVTTDDSSVFLSPTDDNMSCDSWSVCSDYHTRDLHSPMSPNGHICSGDENESVIDRIRRKSFYTRFNEQKRPRKASLNRNYKDLDLYNKEYGSLDRKAYDYTPRSSYQSRNYKSMNDYVNVPSRYQTYSSRIGRPVASSSVYSDAEDGALDDALSAARSRKYGIQPSILSRTSPVCEQYYRPGSSVLSNLSSHPHSEAL